MGNVLKSNVGTTTKKKKRFCVKIYNDLIKHAKVVYEHTFYPYTKWTL